ncbi:hypothetical protein JOM56_011176 [Amanita muscaria]
MNKAPLISFTLAYGFRKLEDYVTFPEYLDLTPFLALRKEDIINLESREKAGKDRKGTTNEKKNERCMYRFYAVVVHIGNMLGGHYVAYTAIPDRLSARPDSRGGVESTSLPDVAASVLVTDIFNSFWVPKMFYQVQILLRKILSFCVLRRRLREWVEDETVRLPAGSNDVWWRLWITMSIGFVSFLYWTQSLNLFNLYVALSLGMGKGTAYPGGFWGVFPRVGVRASTTIFTPTPRVFMAWLQLQWGTKGGGAEGRSRPDTSPQCPDASGALQCMHGDRGEVVPLAKPSGFSVPLNPSGTLTPEEGFPYPWGRVGFFEGKGRATIHLLRDFNLMLFRQTHGPGYQKGLAARFNHIDESITTDKNFAKYVFIQAEGVMKTWESAAEANGKLGSDRTILKRAQEGSPDYQLELGFVKDSLAILVFFAGNVHFLTVRKNFTVIEFLLGLEKGELNKKLCKMHSVLSIVPEESVGVYHRSFLEFLLDHKRSGKYHIAYSNGLRRILILTIRAGFRYNIMRFRWQSRPLPSAVLPGPPDFQAFYSTCMPLSTP